MMVTFVSQCEKKALNRTRRVLDAFANRIGSNTWQTIITQEGLLAVKKLLRKTASKNTAVSCHWIRSRSRSDLIWIVGNKKKFNEQGYVPVNVTNKKIPMDVESDWRYLPSIQIIATLSALLHDIGKTTNGFQKKLSQYTKLGDPYRHEWLSLKIFEIMISGCETDEAWLKRFSNINNWLKSSKVYDTLENTDKDTISISSMPPLAQWISWLIVTHHRLPPNDKVFLTYKEKERLRKSNLKIKQSLAKYHSKIAAFDYWVKNPKTLEEATNQVCCSFWQIDNSVLNSTKWQKHLKRWSNKALQNQQLMTLSKESTEQNTPISNPQLLYISRLCLMVGDHNYSSLQTNDKRRQYGTTELKDLAANTNRTTGEVNQALDEHLIGVGTFTASFAHKINVIQSGLPQLSKKPSLENDTPNKNFKWQNKAYKLAKSIQEGCSEHGFFGVNMASTGCGKTIGNARIMYGLADPKKGARFTIALGLRVLTLQTGQSFRDNLNLNKDELAILVGGSANKKLFELNNDQEINHELPINYKNNTFGSESSEQIIDELVDSEINYEEFSHLNLDTVIENHKARSLLFSPIVTCTIDHIIQASECKRGGKYIAPLLRLLSSDLILDEPDDFDIQDLPALTRLVNLAGLMGTKILLSSATLTPDIVEGLFDAYISGRKIYNEGRSKASPKVVCAWFDEQEKSASSSQCSNTHEFSAAHHSFITKRELYLSKQGARRIAGIIDLDSATSTETDSHGGLFPELSQKIVNNAIQLHKHHHQVDPLSHKEISIGLVRIANIKNIIQITRCIFETVSVEPETHLHIACYHAKQLLILRNILENKLDRILKRDNSNPNKIFEHQEIADILKASNAKKHIFIVLASPVAEVGRDHDYDWAIVEPSSMRSIIQLAGRVWRHRPDKIARTTNIMILQNNIRYLKQGATNPVFTRPGFETKEIKLDTYDAHNILTKEQLEKVDSRPRIHRPTHSELNTLSDLEHRALKNTINNDKLNYVNAYWSTEATANKCHTLLQQISEFRKGSPQEDWLIIPNNESGFDAYYAIDVYENSLNQANKQNKTIQPFSLNLSHKQISPWLQTSLLEALNNLQAHDETQSLKKLAITYATVSLDEHITQWGFNEYLGFINTRDF